MNEEQKEKSQFSNIFRELSQEKRRSYSRNNIIFLYLVKKSFKETMIQRDSFEFFNFCITFAQNE